jgi:hypothetical protein
MGLGAPGGFPVKIEFKTDAIMLIPSCVLFRDAKGWAIGIGWLCWGTLIRFPNAALTGGEAVPSNGVVGQLP